MNHHDSLPQPTLLLGPLELLHQIARGLRPLCLRLALLGLSCSAWRLLLSLWLASALLTSLLMACCTSRGRGNIFPARARPGTGMCTARARKLKAQDVLSSLELSDEERVLVLRRIR